MLKKIRIAAAAFFIAAATLLFLDYTGTVHAYLGWCARIQFVPAVFALNAAVLAVLVLATLLFGRVYCSVVCPLGVFQDIISRLAGAASGKNRFAHSPPCKKRTTVRYALLGAFVAAALLTAVFNIPPLAALIEPYSAYGRIVSQLFAPLYKYGNNVLAHFSERAGNYSFYTVDVWLTGAGALAVAAATFVVAGVFAWRSGRGYCNTICPAGAVLGLLAKFSAVKPRINREKCASCGQCAKSCKASCIDPVRKNVDYSRCVSCFNCLDRCSLGAMRYAASAPVKKN